jgi:hypothetical protein
VPLQAQTEDAGVKGSFGNGRAENRFQELAFWHGRFPGQTQIDKPVGNRGTVKIGVWIPRDTGRRQEFAQQGAAAARRRANDIGVIFRQGVSLRLAAASYP